MNLTEGNTKSTKTFKKHKNIKKFLKGVSEREIIFKMFPSHERRLFMGSQTALGECRRGGTFRRKTPPLKA